MFSPGLPAARARMMRTAWWLQAQATSVSGCSKYPPGCFVILVACDDPRVCAQRHAVESSRDRAQPSASRRSKARYRDCCLAAGAGQVLMNLPAHLLGLLEDLADLVFRDDQRRRERDGVAGDAEHQPVFVERLLHALIGALAERVGARGEVDRRD